MVISGKGSTYDYYEALQLIKNKMGSTHEKPISVHEGDCVDGVNGTISGTNNPEIENSPPNDDLRHNP